MKPTLSGNPTSFLVTAAQVLFNNVDIGFVSGVGIKIKHETTEVKTDQAGKVVVNHFYVGDTITVEMMLDEITAKRLKSAYPFGSLIGTYPAQRIAWGQPVGGDFYSLAQQLIIRPTVDDVNFKNRNFTFYKAIPVGDSDVKYTPEKKTEIKTTFHCYPDFTKPTGEFFGYFGDILSGTFNGALAGAPSFTGTGNGTLANIVVNNVFTQTETWTATCIHATGASAIFAVSGSVTGARGNATSGTNFFSNTITPGNSEVQFLISEGTTPFVVGDSFSFTTTQANYT